MRPAKGLTCKETGRTVRLIGSHANCAEDDPMECAIRKLAGQSKQRAAATDFNVVGMSAETKDVERSRGIRGQI